VTDNKTLVDGKSIKLGYAIPIALPLKPFPPMRVVGGTENILKVWPRR
jgi:hypothetical protein